jgi:hypothetical protein
MHAQQHPGSFNPGIDCGYRPFSSLVQRKSKPQQCNRSRDSLMMFHRRGLNHAIVTRG